MPGLTALYSFADATLIGLVIGIERERSHTPDVESAGVRTFILLAILGALAASFGDREMASVMTLFVSALVIAAYWRSTRRNSALSLGFTTEVSAMMTFGLGYLSVSEHGVALVLGLAVFAVLYSRTWLHHFSREVLQPGEIRAVLLLSALLLGIMPLLPPEAIDPWGIVHLRNLAKVIGALAAIQFASHVAIRAFGNKLGILMTGFFAGLVSSTSVFLTLPMRVKQAPELTRYFYAAGLLATVATLSEFLVVVAMIDAELLSALAAPVVVMVSVALLFSLFFVRTHGASNSMTSSPMQLSVAAEATSPLDLKSVFKLSGLISLMLLLVSASNRWFGAAALGMTVLLGALFELQGVSYSTSELFLHGDIDKTTAIFNLSLAVAAAILSKILILGFLNRGRFALVFSGILGLMLLIGASVVFLIAKVSI